MDLTQSKNANNFGSFHERKLSGTSRLYDNYGSREKSKDLFGDKSSRHEHYKSNEKKQSKSFIHLKNLMDVPDRKFDEYSYDNYGSSYRSNDLYTSPRNMATSAKREHISRDYTVIGSYHDNPVTGSTKKLRGDGMQRNAMVGANGVVLREERQQSTNRSIASAKRQRDLQGHDIFSKPTSGENRDIFAGARGSKPTRTQCEKFQVTSPQVDPVAGIGFENKGRKLYFKESALNKCFKTDIFKQ